MSPSDPARTGAIGRECWLPTLQLATQEVFELMLACPLEVPAEPPSGTPSRAPSEEGLDITSMVGLAGKLCGILTVRCSSKSAVRMVSRMLELDTDEAGPEAWDAVGEICNMVAGNFKNKIAGLGDGCMLSLPTVINGAEYDLHSMVNNEIHTVLLFEGEPIWLSLEVYS